MEKSNGKKGISAKLELRFHLMGMIHNNVLKEVRIPGSRELAKEFGLARSTVQLELEKLCAQGWLVARHGIGTFTNPANITPSNTVSGETRPLIGILYEQGDYFFYDCGSAALMGSLICAAGRAGGLVHHLQISDDDPEIMFQCIRGMGLSGLLWAGTQRTPALDELCGKLEKNGIPVVSLGHEIPDSGAVMISRESAAAELAESLRAKNVNILRIGDIHIRESVFDAFKKAFSGKALWRFVPGYPHETFTADSVRDILESGFIPDIIFTPVSYVLPIAKIIRKMNLHSEIAALGECAKSDLLGGRGCCFTHPFTQEADTAVSELIRRIKGGEPRTIVLDGILLRLDT